ncbi:tetratricopeptide repeat protein [Rhodocyclus purpureus]|uniref:tetratricopeptide repeat protein n=1 Tax=Rhodocyclus purpureus TaxID=1067 RepID=UPI001912C1A4|nr:tetratricopeptide repeat protein [Rhodocyclus purpureus]
MQTTKARLLATFLMLAAATAFAATDYDNVSTETDRLLSAAEYSRAIAQREEAVRTAEQKTGEASLQTAKALYELASLVHDQGDYARAEALYQRTLSILERALDPDHPAVASCINNLAMIYKAQGQYAKAEPLYRRSLAIQENALGAEHPDVAVSLNNLAQLYRTLGMHAKADPLYQRSLAILEKNLGPRHPKTLTVRENMAPRSGKTAQLFETPPLMEGARTAALGRQAAVPAAAASAPSVPEPLGGAVGDLIAAGSTWLKRAPEKNYFIQISSSEAAGREVLERQIASLRRHLDPKQLRAYRPVLSGRDEVVIIYGNYDSAAAGRKALAQLPPSILKFQPLLRQVSQVR